MKPLIRKLKYDEAENTLGLELYYLFSQLYDQMPKKLDKSPRSNYIIDVDTAIEAGFFGGRS